jgi:DNA-binding LacI/PurR family transcriptional regulator
MVDIARQERATFGVNRDRLQGFLNGFSAAGISRDHITIEEIGEGTQDREAELATVRLLTRRPRPTALIAMSDRLALAACGAAESAGIAIPDELSVVGFDDVPDAMRSTPSLTTIRQSHIDKGRLAGQLLIDLMAGKTVAGSTLMHTELVIRESSRPPRHQ